MVLSIGLTVPIVAERLVAARQPGWWLLGNPLGWDRRAYDAAPGL